MNQQWNMFSYIKSPNVLKIASVLYLSGLGLKHVFSFKISPQATRCLRATS